MEREQESMATKPDDAGGARGTLGELGDTVVWLFQATVKIVAMLIWLAVGIVFWIPLLVRRLVLFVVFVLIAGLTGGDTERPSRHLRESLRFYWTGIERIASAFEPESKKHESRTRYFDNPRNPKPRRRFIFEVIWAGFFWGTMAWAVGLWPEAPQILAATFQDLGNLLAEIGSAIRRWWYSTFAS